MIWKEFAFFIYEPLPGYEEDKEEQTSRALECIIAVFPISTMLAHDEWPTTE